MITAKEREVIRDLAKRLAELASLPIMEERRKLWYAHNDLKTDQPVIDCSPEGAWREVVTPESLVCEDPVAREIEWTLRARIYRAEVINDDVPAELRWDCRKRISDTGWSIEGRQAHNAFTNESVHVPTISTINPFWRKDYKFDETAAEFDPLITDDEMEEGGIEELLVAPKVIYDEEGSKRDLEIHQDLLGDILDVHWCGNTYIAFSWMETYTKIRGFESALYDLYDYPDQMHAILRVLEKGYLNLYQQQLDMGLLEMNNGCQYNGTGGYGYTHDLPDLKPGDKLSFKNLWAYAESQEFVSGLARDDQGVRDRLREPPAVQLRSVGLRLLRQSREKATRRARDPEYPPHFGLSVGGCRVHARADRHEGDLLLQAQSVPHHQRVGRGPDAEKHHAAHDRRQGHGV